MEWRKQTLWSAGAWTNRETIEKINSSIYFHLDWVGMMSTQFFMASLMLSVLFYIFPYRNPQSAEILTALINLKAFSWNFLLKIIAKSLECSVSWLAT